MILNEIVVVNFQPFLFFSFPGMVAAVLCVLLSLECVMWCDNIVTCNIVMRRCDNPQHCLQMQINFPHTSASADKLFARNAQHFVHQFEKRSFVCSISEVLVEIHQFEVREVRMPPLSLQINLRSGAHCSPSMNGEFKDASFTSISCLNKLGRVREQKADCKLIKPCSSPNPSQISYQSPISHCDETFYLSTQNYSFFIILGHFCPLPCVSEG